MRSIVTSLCVLALPVLFGCKPEEEPTLFDEKGVWSLEKYALDGGAIQDIAQERKNAFLLNYNPDVGAVAIGSCVSGDNQDVQSAICTGNMGAAYWECQCFAYTFEKSRMVWQPYNPGDPIPEVGDPFVPESGAVEILLEEFPSLGGGYEYTPLPMGVFESDGMTSKYVFQQKAASLWDSSAIPVNEADIRSLTECSLSCFGPE